MVSCPIADHRVWVGNVMIFVVSKTISKFLDGILDEANQTFMLLGWLPTPENPSLYRESPQSTNPNNVL